MCVGLLLPVVCLAGCADQPSVQEDRSVTFAPGADGTAFQHGDKGIFVEIDGELTKVFDPDPEILAVSTPHWSTSGEALIFTTARAVETESNAAEVQDTPRPTATLETWDEAPEGRTFFRQPVRYTCWLRKKATDAEPEKLFEADCDDIGFVAADLAVRWGRDNREILYIRGAEENRHGLFRFDLETKKSQQVFPHAAEVLLFDRVPGGDQFACLTGRRVMATVQTVKVKDGEPATAEIPRTPQESLGLWIGTPGEDDSWWHVPDSAPSSEGLRTLIAMRPTWTNGGGRFAFPASREETVDAQTTRRFYQVQVGTLKKQSTETRLSSPRPIRELRWAPDGERIGLIRSPEAGGTTPLPSLHVLAANGTLSEPIGSGAVRHFAGWNATGDLLASVRPDPTLQREKQSWALLLIGDPFARDTLQVISDAKPHAAPQELVSGVRITFPHWSPETNELSFWGTFQPTHRSWPSMMLGMGLRAGDPAARIDATTGTLHWMPVDAREHAQVANYYLLKRDYAEAQKWFDKADKQRDAESEQQQPGRNLPQILATLADERVFRSHCLRQLGRQKEADALLAEFRRTFPLPVARPDETNDENAPASPQDLALQLFGPMLGPPQLARELSQDYYIAEALLSVDAPREARALFERSLKNATTDHARLSRAILLSQIQLLQDDTLGYAQFVTNTLGPQLIRYWETRVANAASELREPFTAALVFHGGLALSPMYSKEFVAQIPPETLEPLVRKWETLLTDETADLFLAEAYESLERDKERLAVAQRLAVNPQRLKILPQGTIEAAIKEIRAAASAVSVIGAGS